MKTITLPAIAFLFLIPALLGILPNAAYAVNDQPPPAPTEDYDPFGDGQDENGLIPDDNGEDIDEELSQSVEAASTEHCPNHEGHPNKVQGANNSFVPPAGAEFCVKGSTDAVYIASADGVTTAYEYLGNGHDVSYYIVYTVPTPTPTEGPCDLQVCGVTATEVPTETPTPTETPLPSWTPSSTPFDMTPTVTSSPDASQTPTSTATEFNQPEDPTPTRETEIVTTLPDTGSGPSDDEGTPVAILGMISLAITGAILGFVWWWEGRKKKY